MRPLWVWPCRHDLFGLAIARLARKSHAHKRSCLQGHAHKGLIPLETQKANSHRSIAKIHFYQAKILVGVAIKSGRGNVKGRGIYPPPPCIHSNMYIILQIVLKKACHIKKDILASNGQKTGFFFHIFEKIVLFWSLMASFKAFASLRLQSEAIRGQKNTFTLMKKTITVFGPFLERKILFLHDMGEKSTFSHRVYFFLRMLQS